MVVYSIFFTDLNYMTTPLCSINKDMNKIETTCSQYQCNHCMNFTDEQRAILNHTESSFRVLAGAGSGKTTTLANYVKQEIELRGTKPEEICFITFTRFAAKEIRVKVAKNVGSNVPILCGTFHASMWKLLRQAGIQAPEPKHLYDARMNEWVLFMLVQMREQNPALAKILRTFKCLIIDEFQDLDEEQFEFVKLFKEINPAVRVIAIGDLAQNIYRFRGTSNEFLRTRLKAEIDRQLKTFRLTTNFRSSRKILDVANTLFKAEIAENKILPMVPCASAIEGVKPEYFEFAMNPGKGYGEYEERVVETLLPIIKDAKLRGKSLVLIFPALKCQSFQLITALLRQASRACGYCFDIHEISKEDETCSTVEFTYDPKSTSAPIQCSSFHSAKGLEWDIVALVNITDNMYNSFGREEENEAFVMEKTNLFYVGVTRAMERLLLFGNANMGGRHRHLAKLGDDITKVFQFTAWGEEMKDPNSSALKPIGVRDLIRKLPQHPDLYEKIRKCTESIPCHSVDGHPMIHEYVYTKMKLRNRELAFGTFIDWKLKKELCTGGCKTLQDCLIELAPLITKHNWIHKTEAKEDVLLRTAKLDVFFMNAHYTPKGDLLNYVSASRYLAQYKARQFAFVESFRNLYTEIEDILESVMKKSEKTLTDEYILAQMREFYIKGFTKEIQAVSAPEDSYQGLPYDLEAFMEENTAHMRDSIEECLESVGGACESIRGDVPLESASLIMGEADLVHDASGVILEVKCSASPRAIDLRDSGDCKNLLQVLTYAALGRHGTIPLAANWAFLVNPLTAAWESYDLREWKVEDSRIFMDCLEELRERSV
jgi:hypothetical protein